MAVSPFNKFSSFVAACANGVHNLSTAACKVMLTNTLPLAANAKYGDISANELANGNGYTTGGTTATLVSSTQTGGLYTLILNDVAFTAGPSTMGPFRYVVLYNNTDATTPKGLIGWWDNGSPVTLNNTEVFTVDLDQVNGVLTLQ